MVDMVKQMNKRMAMMEKRAEMQNRKMNDIMEKMQDMSRMVMMEKKEAMRNQKINDTMGYG